jgi:hypothetical protein
VKAIDVSKIKKILKIHDVVFEKEVGDQCVSIKLRGQEIASIVPDCQDPEFLRVEQLTEFNAIKSFELLWESGNSTSNESHLFLNAFSMALEYMFELENQWKGKDVREFGSVLINLQK